MAKFIALTNRSGAMGLFNVDHIIAVLAPKESETGSLLVMVPGGEDDTAHVKESPGEIGDLLRAMGV